jgi:hypothetical protein
VSVNAPRFTSNSPQLHHKNTTFKPQVSQNPLQKQPFHHSKKKVNTLTAANWPCHLSKAKGKAQTVLI